MTTTPAPSPFPPIEPPADLVGQETAGTHVRCATHATYALHPYDPAVDAVLHGLLCPSVLSSTQCQALQQQLARNPIQFATAPRSAPTMPIGMHEPRWARFIPSTATAFWMAVAATLALLLARAEGWL